MESTLGKVYHNPHYHVDGDAYRRAGFKSYWRANALVHISVLVSILSHIQRQVMK